MKWFALFIFIINCFHATHSYTSKDVSMLKAMLMEGYDTDTNPVSNTAKIDASMAVFLHNIGDLDEQSETLTAVVSTLIKWRDENMVWDENATGIDSITMDPSRVWVPELILLNPHYQQTSGRDGKRSVPVSYNSSGFAVYEQLIITETTCDLDTWRFPFDHQVCSIEFTTTKQNTEITTILKNVVLSNLEPDGSWDVINASISIFHHSFFKVKLVLSRKPTFIIVNLVLPLSVLVVLSPIVFLLPNNTGERVGFSVTVLLALSVYMTILSDHVPNKSNPMPLLSTMLFISYLTTSCVVIVVIINARVYRLPTNVRIPHVFVCLHAITKCLCCCFQRRKKGSENLDEANTLLKEEELTKCMCPCFQRREKGSENLDEANTRLKEKENYRHIEMDPPKYLIGWKDVGWAIDMLFLILFYTIKLVLISVAISVLLTHDESMHDN